MCPVVGASVNEDDVRIAAASAGGEAFAEAVVPPGLACVPLVEVLLCGVGDRRTGEGNVDVQRGSVIEDSVIMPGAKIGKNVKIKKAIVGENAIIGDGSVVEEEDGKIAVVGNHEKIGVLPNENK